MFDEGQRNIEAALAGYPKSAHAAHIRGHLFYELGEREAGLAFLTDWMKDYSRDGLMHATTAGTSRCGRWRPDAWPTPGASTTRR